MAPEQAAADPHTDHRADLYALGVLGYEILAGQPPFTAPTAQAVVAAHMLQTPVPLAELRPSVPAALAALVMRCLAKRPADRPQSAAEVLHQLEGAGRRRWRGRRRGRRGPRRMDRAAHGGTRAQAMARAGRPRCRRGGRPSRLADDAAVARRGGARCQPGGGGSVRRPRRAARAVARGAGGRALAQPRRRRPAAERAAHDGDPPLERPGGPALRRGARAGAPERRWW